MRNKKLNFQEKMAKLEEVQNAIQTHEDTNLEKLIQLYEQGLSLASELEKEIEKYEKRIQDVISSDSINNEEYTISEQEYQNDMLQDSVKNKTPQKTKRTRIKKDTIEKKSTDEKKEIQDTSLFPEK